MMRKLVYKPIKRIIPQTDATNKYHLQQQHHHQCHQQHQPLQLSKNDMITRSNKSNQKQVRFCKRLVSQEIERPRTDPEEISKLFFTKHEIDYFKRRTEVQKQTEDNSNGIKKKGRRLRLIRFADEIVSETRIIPKIPERDIPSFFYTQSELEQTFAQYLSDFDEKFVSENCMQTQISIDRNCWMESTSNMLSSSTSHTDNDVNMAAPLNLNWLTKPALLLRKSHVT